MQVVFVHGVNTRKRDDGSYDRYVEGRTDRLNRLAFGGTAVIANPYWGEFGHAGNTLASIPSKKGSVESLGLFPPAAATPRPTLVAAAKADLTAAVATLSSLAIADATERGTAEQRRLAEDYWIAAAQFADDRPTPAWLSTLSSDAELKSHLDAEVATIRRLQSLGGWAWPTIDLDAMAADQIRGWTSGLLGQFLGDAMMFFARRDASNQIRQMIARHIVDAGKAASQAKQPLVLIGHSMGGSILHEMLTDPEEVRAIEAELARPLEVDLFLGVGTQVGLFAELNQFSKPAGGSPLAAACKHYWNVYDYADALAFVCSGLVPGVADFEVSTSGGLLKSHTAYFDNALFFTRLNARLKSAGLLS